jgi:hypothetical protein
MRTFFVTLCALFLLLLAGRASAQTETTETKTSIDSATGKQTTTYSTSVSRSEDITPRANMIVINPLKFFLFYNLSYYRAVSKNIVVGGGLQMPTPSGLSGFGINAEMRFHPSGKALRGFYIAPNISYNSLTETISGNETTTNPFSIGILAGWQWFPGDEFAMGLGIGVDYYTGSISDNSETSSLTKFEGAVPALRFDIGYAW